MASDATLKDGKALTREDVLTAVSRVFRAQVQAVEGFWNVQIQGSPVREVVFTADWVEHNIRGGAPVSMADFERRLSLIADEDWWVDPKTGMHIYLVR